jgi:hypothetical protein
MLFIPCCTQIPDSWPHWINKPGNVSSYHSDKILGQIYDRVISHPVNEQLQMQLLLRDNDPDQYAQQLQEQAEAVAAAWMQRLQGWPLLGDAVVLLPAELGVLWDYQDDLYSMIKNWKVYVVGE